MMDGHFFALVGLVSGQVLLYRIGSREALKTLWFLILFYFFLFSFVQGLRIFCALLAIPFYDLPLLSLAIFLVFGKGIRNFLRFRKAFRAVPDFCLLSGLWISLIWLGLFSTHNLWDGFLWSFFTALLLPVLAGLKERLALIDPPDEFRGLPLFLMAVGLLVLALLFFFV